MYMATQHKSSTTTNLVTSRDRRLAAHEQIEYRKRDVRKHCITLTFYSLPRCFFSAKFRQVPIEMRCECGRVQTISLAYVYAAGIFGVETSVE